MYGYRSLEEYFHLMDVEDIHADDEMIESWNVFCTMSTQWRVGPNGPVGLDYNVLPMLFDVYNISSKESCLNDLRIMEGQALASISKLKK